MQNECFIIVGTSMGMNSLNFANTTSENKSPMSLPFDSKLLGQLKNFLPGKYVH